MVSCRELGFPSDLGHVSVSHFEDMARTEAIFDTDVGMVKFAKAERLNFIRKTAHGRTGSYKVLLGGVAAGLLKVSVAPPYLVRSNRSGK